MIIIYIMFVIVAVLIAAMLKPGITQKHKSRIIAGADYDEFKYTIDNYSKAIEVERGKEMAEFFMGSMYLMLGKKRRARASFSRAKIMGKPISKQTWDLCQ